MQMKLTTTLAVLLLAGASGAAMAQDRDHGERGQSAPQTHAQPQPQQHAGPPPGGGGHFGGPQHEGGQRGPGPAEHEHAGPPQSGGFHGREGQSRGPEATPGGPQQHSNREAGPGPGSGGQRQFDRDRHEVIPPGARPGSRPEGRPEGRPDGRFDGRSEGHFQGRPDNHVDGRVAGRPLFGGTHGAPPHWRAGRFPPVMWAHDRFRAGSYRQPYGYYSRAWAFGDFLPRPWFAHDYWLDDFLDFDLPYPPPGFVWVRVGPDAVMIDRFTGRVVQVVRGIFW
jgi:Ni/Co efflux regulator RcnB